MIRTVVSEVCAVVGVRPPDGTIFALPSQNRTMWEMTHLANEMAQRIAYDTRDWQLFRILQTYFGNGEDQVFALPADFQRMLKETNVYLTTQPNNPLTFISDPDEWLRGEIGANVINPNGEWTIYGNMFRVRPVPPNGSFIKFWYLSKNCVELGTAPGNYTEKFITDTDKFRLPERLLRLGMIWQWKANKGGTYAEDIANYEDALNMISGSDKPSPTIIGRLNQSAAANQSYPYPTPSAPETPYP